MNIKLFLEICQEFFDAMYSPLIEDIIENDVIQDEEKCWQDNEWQDNEWEERELNMFGYIFNHKNKIE